jgi:hypothetical protein
MVVMVVSAIVLPPEGQGLTWLLLQALAGMAHEMGRGGLGWVPGSWLCGPLGLRPPSHCNAKKAQRAQTWRLPVVTVFGMESRALYLKPHPRRLLNGRGLCPFGILHVVLF